MATTIQGICDVCEEIVTDEALVLTGWLEGVTFCQDHEDEFDAWIEMDNANPDSIIEDDDTMGFPQDAIPYPMMEDRKDKDSEKIRNIAARIVDCDELLSADSTWEKYGISDAETKNKITIEVMRIFARGNH